MTKISLVFEIEKILEAIGVEARSTTSGEYKGHCPMHFQRVGKIDRKPSWSVNEETGQHHCFSCGYGGSLLDLVTDLTDMDPWSALRWLRSEGLQALDVVYRDIVAEEKEEAFKAKLVPSVQERWMLFDSPPKSERLERRISRKACKHFDVRWTEGGWAIPVKTWQGDFRGYQLKRGSFVSNEPEGMRKSDHLFGLDVFPPGETAVLVESPLDVLRLWDVGVHGVASFGVFVSNEQIDLLQAFTDRVTLALDMDIAGRQQNRRLYHRLHNTVPKLRFLNYRCTKKVSGVARPKDVGEMTDEEITECVEDAVTGAEALAMRFIASKEEMPEPPKRDKKKVKRRRR